MSNQAKKQQGGVKIPRFFILTGKFLQALSPGLATKYVRFLFQKPIKHKTPENEKILEKKAEISYLAIPEIGKSIAVYQWGKGDKKALVVHGWSGRATQMHKIINKLLEAGYQVTGFDAPAHGKSTGTKTMMPEFIKTIEKVSENFGPFEVAIGHSMGGIALLNVQSRQSLFKKLVIIGAPDSIFNIFHNFVKRLELKPSIADKLIAIFEKITGKSIFEFHGSYACKNIEEPVLIIHDEDDKEVPVNDAKNNYKNLKNGNLLITKGLGHTRILKNKDVIDNIMKFIKKNHMPRLSNQ